MCKPIDLSKKAMNFINTKPAFRLFCIGIAFIAIFSSCKREQIKPTPDDFTMEVREELGSALNDAILNNPEQFAVLDKEEYSGNIYLYMDSMMQQVANLYFFNNTNSGWNQDREWEAYVVLDDELEYAFCLPGGNFYISSGFLRQIQSDYELFYDNYLCFDCLQDLLLTLVLYLTCPQNNNDRSDYIYPSSISKGLDDYAAIYYNL